MFIIYTKDKKPQVKFTVNLTREEVKELMQDNLFLDYPELNKEDFIIVEQEQVFKHPINDNTGIIREMTREELVEIGVEVSLEEGEIIKGNKIIKLAKPSQYHKWTGKEWSVNLEEVKEQKREKLKNIRDKKLRDNIFLHDAEFQIRNDIDIENFKDVERGINRGYSKLTDKRNWILADNSIRPFTNEQLLEVLDEKGKRKEKLFNYFGLLSLKLAQATTVEEIEKIVWE